MLKVLFDYQHFSEQQYGGISRYFANIMHGIDKRPEVTCYLGALYTQNYYIKDIKLPLKNQFGTAILANKRKREIQWNQKYSKYLIQLSRYDVFHPTYYHPYFLAHIKKPFVITVHDMIHEKFPESFVANDPVANYKREVIARASKIIAISQSTKDDLIEILKVPEKKIQVIHHGIKIHDTPVDKAALTLDIPKDFVLYVGDRNHYKNFNLLAEALSLILPKHKDLYLICTGGFQFSTAEVKHLHKLNIIHRCIRLTVTDAELTQLYQHARLLISPSLYEGFGYPVLEAFREGCAVAASKIAGTIEVGGDAVNYFDPNEVSSICSALETLLTNDGLKQDLIKKGHERVKQFDLNREVTETINVYKEVAQ